MNGEYYTPKNIMEAATQSARDIERKQRLLDAAEDLLEVLKVLLPMQGCITCQECYMRCELHGDINITTEQAQRLIRLVDDGE